MSVSAPTRSAAIGTSSRVKRRKPPVVRSATIEPASRRPQQLQLESISAQWQRALDAADRALLAAQGDVPASELQPRKHELNRERQQTATELGRLAAVAGIQPAPWLSPVMLTTRMLGLPVAARACLFDLEGVLTDSGQLHAWAWGEVFDDFLLRLSDKTGWHFVPFDRIADYRDYVDGRSRLEGFTPFSTVVGSAFQKDDWTDRPTSILPAASQSERSWQWSERLLYVV